MNKLNKKGFTLIEMLVVIAIIAVLVSIIIPTVSSATDKAAAATNAANLRSIKAEVVTAMLTNDESKYDFTYDTTTGKLTAVGVQTGVTLPKAKACGGLAKDTDMTIAPTDDGKDITVTYGTNTIDMFAKVAAGEAEKTTIVAAGSTTQP